MNILSACTYINRVCLVPWGGQKRVLDSLELKLQMVVSLWMWVLGIKPVLSTRATSPLNHWTVFPALTFAFIDCLAGQDTLETAALSVEEATQLLPLSNLC